jgi:23S rRNA (adenine-N6)-dimethyltransferase
MEKFSNVTVWQGDFMKMDLPAESYKVFANIPFHLSSPIVRKLVEDDHPPEAIYLIVQKQFADKLQIDSDKFTAMLGAYIAPWFSVRIRKRLQKTDFWPHPNVDTAFVELNRRDNPLLPRTQMAEYEKFIQDCFSTPKVFLKTPRDQAGIPLDLKPSQVSLEQWLRLFTAAKK